MSFMAAKAPYKSSVHDYELHRKIINNIGHIIGNQLPQNSINALFSCSICGSISYMKRPEM